MDEPESPTGGERNRRSFLNWLLGTSVGALFGSVLYPAARFLSPPAIPEASTRQVEAGPVNDPELLDKGFKILRFGNESVILVRLGDEEYRAFAGTCTHLDCIVEFHQEPRRIWCNCHNGEYDLQGRVVAGPPPRPLEPFPGRSGGYGARPAQDHRGEPRVRKPLSRAVGWITERLPLGPIRDFASHKTVPVHRYTVLYYFGGMTLFFFLVQVATGLMMMLYYRPSRRAY